MECFPDVRRVEVPWGDKRRESPSSSAPWDVVCLASWLASGMVYVVATWETRVKPWNLYVVSLSQMTDREPRRGAFVLVPTSTVLIGGVVTSRRKDFWDCNAKALS